MPFRCHEPLRAGDSMSYTHIGVIYDKFIRFGCQGYFPQLRTIWLNFKGIFVVSHFPRSEYIRLGKSSESWYCIRCNNCSVNSFTFHGYNIPTSNSFSVFQAAGEDSVFYADRFSVLSPDSDFIPGVFSSPRGSSMMESKTSCSSANPEKSKNHSFPNPNGKLRILTLNAKSAKGKAAETEAMCDYVRPDVIVTETKLDKSVSPSELYQGHVILKDRTLHGGGVLITLKKD